MRRSASTALVIRRQYPDIALLVLSQYVEESCATDLLSAATSSVGYLLKDRVAQVTDFLDAVRRVAGGGPGLPRRAPGDDHGTGRALRISSLTSGRSTAGTCASSTSTTCSPEARWMVRWYRG